MASGLSPLPSLDRRRKGSSLILVQAGLSSNKPKEVTGVGLGGEGVPGGGAFGTSLLVNQVLPKFSLNIPIDPSLDGGARKLQEINRLTSGINGV